MIENLKIVFHSVAEKMAAKLTELLGWSVTGTAAIITSLSLIDLINGVLQTIALMITIAGGIATYIYIRKKTRNLSSHGNKRT